MQVIELIILAALAAVVLYQLYAVLGRRVGRGPESLAQPASAQADSQRALAAPAEAAPTPDGLAAHFVPTAGPVTGVIFARECVRARGGAAAA